jgi:hypothetical protein
MSVDFPANRLGITVGRAGPVKNHESLAGCVQQQFQSVSLGAVEHEHPRYTVSYAVILTAKPGLAPPPEAQAAPPSAAAPRAVAVTSAANAAGDATVEVLWDMAVVRDVPRVGQVVGRLPRGSRVQLGATQEGWYRVRFGADFGKEGWVYRGAVGR